MLKSLILCVISFQLLWLDAEGGGWTVLGNQGHQYLYVQESKNWADAENECVVQKGHLASINSQVENDAINNFLNTNGKIWFGFSDGAKEGTWVYTDGSDNSYTNWKSDTNEPNGGTGENCAIISDSVNWIDINCGDRYYFLCERVVSDVKWTEMGPMNHNYLLIKTSKTWQDAENDCVSLDAHLLSINSEEEQNTIIDLLNKEKETSLWTGLNDNAQEGNWVYTDGSTYTYTDWNQGTGEPNGGTSENCMEFTTTLDSNWDWNDFPCGKTHHYVCEKAGAGGTVVLSDSDEVVSMECDSNKVKIEIDTNEIPENEELDSRHLYVGPDKDDSECQPKNEAGILTFEFPLTSCNPTTTHDDAKIKYSYSITSASYTLGEAGISRDSDVGLTVTCAFTRTGSASAMYIGAVTIAKYEDEYLGTLSFEMALFSDSGYTNKIMNTETVRMNDPVYARIKMLSVAEWQMYVTDCTSSPTEGGSSLEYDLITGGCFMDDTMVENSVSDPLRSYGFKFDAYRFKGAASTDVYITCKVVVCKPEATEEVCKKAGDCSARKRELANSVEAASRKYEITHKFHVA